MMKKLIFALILAQSLLFNMLNSSPIDYTNLPVYTGNINDPGITVIIHEEDFFVIEIDGEYYIYYE
jgi:hypothetical protein